MTMDVGTVAVFVTAMIASFAIGLRVGQSMAIRLCDSMLREAQGRTAQRQGADGK